MEKAVFQAVCREMAVGASHGRETRLSLRSREEERETVSRTSTRQLRKCLGCVGTQ